MMQPACRNAIPCALGASTRCPRATNQPLEIRGASSAARAKPKQAGELDQPGALRQAEEPGGGAHQREPAEERPDQPALRRARSVGLSSDLLALDLRASGLDELSVADARRAYRFARAAIEALRHLCDEPGAQEVEPPLRDALDETNPAAGA